MAAGIPVIAILTSQTDKRMKQAGASWTVPDYHDIMQRVKSDTA